MGTRITAKGVDAEAYATEMGVPVRTGIRGIFLTNTDDTKASWNYAPGSSGRGLAVGLPAYNSQYGNYVGLAAGAPKYIDTKVIESLDFTFISIFKMDVLTDPTWPAAPGTDLPNPLRVMPISNYSSNAAGYGVCLFPARNNSVSTLVGVISGDGTKSTSSTAVIVDPTKWLVISGRYSNATKSITTKNHVTGAVATGLLAVGTERNPSTNALRIGAAIGGSFGGKVMVAATQIHNVALSDVDTDRNAAFLRAYVERKGVSFL